MDTLRKNLQPQFDQCLPSIKKEFGILIESILEEADRVEALKNYDDKIKGIYNVIANAKRIFTLDEDIKRLMNKK